MYIRGCDCEYVNEELAMQLDLNLITSVFSQGANVKFWIMDTNAILASNKANLIPMQCRGPIPKGAKEYSGLFFFFSSVNLLYKSKSFCHKYILLLNSFKAIMYSFTYQCNKRYWHLFLTFLKIKNAFWVNRVQLHKMLNYLCSIVSTLWCHLWIVSTNWPNKLSTSETHIA